MATLHGPDGYSVTLMIEQYEYPEKTTGYDANWLEVRVETRHPRGDWWHRSAWMTTVDARRLARWLDDAADEVVDYDWTTLELVFTFAFTTEPRPFISVVVTREALPEWHREEDGRELVIPLGFDASGIKAFADDWRRQLEDYPVRGECK